MSDKPKFEKKKSLGQHFLTSPVVPGWMCDAADIKQDEVVLEIGPGTGVLTKELLNRGAKVVALEADLRAVEVLKETFKEELSTEQLILHHTDVRELNITNYSLVNHGFKVVANIPYYLSGMLFRSFLESRVQPSDLIFLVQKEVAERIARDKKESLLSLSVKAFGEARYIKTVRKGHFIPPPKIDSAIIAIYGISQKNFLSLDMKLFFEILHLGFGQKRKQLLGNLANQYDRNALTNIFSTLSIPLNVRAEDLPLETWLTLVKKITSTANPQTIN